MAKLYTRKSDGTYIPYNPQSVTNIDVVQTTGNSVTAAMSQDAVTKELAKKAKELGLDAIHDTVHEMARDEARHGKAFEGLLKRYFG